MKKIIFCLLSLMIILTMSACSNNKQAEENNEEPVEETQEETPQKEKIIVDGVDLELGEGIPSSFSNKKAYQLELSEDDKANNMIAAYDFVDEDGLIVFFRHPKEGVEIEDIVKNQLDYYYQDQNLTYCSHDCFEKEGDYNFLYYVAFDKDTYNKPYFIHAYFFEDGDNVVEVDYWDLATKVEVEDHHVYLPSEFMKEVTLTDALKEEGVILEFEETELKGAPSLLVFSLDRKNMSEEEIYEWVRSGYDVLSDNSEQEDKSYLFLDFLEEAEDGEFRNYEYIFLSEEKMLAYDFACSNKEDVYSPTIIPSIIYSIDK